MVDLLPIPIKDSLLVQNWRNLPEGVHLMMNKCLFMLIGPAKEPNNKAYALLSKAQTKNPKSQFLSIF